MAKGESHAYGCRTCYRNVIQSGPADVLVELIMRHYLERHRELELKRPTRKPVTVDHTREIEDLEDQADEIMADRSKPRNQRQAEATEIDRQIKILEGAPPVVQVPGRAADITPAEWGALDRPGKREILAELFRIVLLPGVPGRVPFDPSRIQVTLIDGSDEQAAWLAQCAKLAAGQAPVKPRKPRGPQARQEVHCLNCGKRIMAANSRRKFCDAACRYAYRRAHPVSGDEQWERGTKRTCEICGEPFLAAKSTARYCPPPKDCTTRAYRQRYEDRKAAGEVATEAKVYVKQCIMCREDFETSKPNAKYCGDPCRRAGVKARRDAGIPVTQPGSSKRKYPRECEQCGAGSWAPGRSPGSAPMPAGRRRTTRLTGTTS